MMLKIRDLLQLVCISRVVTSTLLEKGCKFAVNRKFANNAIIIFQHMLLNVIFKDFMRTVFNKKHHASKAT